MFSLLLAAAVVPAGQSFTCTPEAVWDGDGPIWCEEGPRIRLAGIAAREIDNTCRRNHPCPQTSGIDARNALVRMIGKPTGTLPYGHITVTGPALTCVSTGSAGGNRTGAWCSSPRYGDLSCAMVQGRYALRWERYWENGRCSRSTTAGSPS